MFRTGPKFSISANSLAEDVIDTITVEGALKWLRDDGLLKQCHIDTAFAFHSLFTHL
jgi:hypothetical protein